MKPSYLILGAPQAAFLGPSVPSLGGRAERHFRFRRGARGVPRASARDESRAGPLRGVAGTSPTSRRRVTRTLQKGKGIWIKSLGFRGFGQLQRKFHRWSFSTSLRHLSLEAGTSPHLSTGTRLFAQREEGKRGRRLPPTVRHGRRTVGRGGRAETRAGAADACQPIWTALARDVEGRFPRKQS